MDSAPSCLPRVVASQIYRIDCSLGRFFFLAASPSCPLRWLPRPTLEVELHERDSEAGCETMHHVTSPGYNRLEEHLLQTTSGYLITRGIVPYCRGIQRQRKANPVSCSAQCVSLPHSSHRVIKRCQTLSTPKRAYAC